MDPSQYTRLTDEGRFDDLIAEVSEEQVAQAWTRYQRRYPADTDDQDWWAVDLWMSDEWWCDEDRVRRGLLRLIDLAETDDELAFIGIAHMEGDFFVGNESRLRWVEEQAAKSQKFRRSLRNLYLWGSDLDGVVERVERAAGTALPRPGGPPGASTTDR